MDDGGVIAPADRQPIVVAIASLYDLEPALVGQIDPGIPVDLRTLPRPLDAG